MGALEGRAMLKWGPAAPMRTKRAINWGMKAHLRKGRGLAVVWGPDLRVDVSYVPFVYVKDGHAEYCYHADNDSGDDDTHDDCHVATVDGGEHLSGDDTTDYAVPDHEDGVEDGDELRWPVSHDISSHNLERDLARSHYFHWRNCKSGRKHTSVRLPLSAPHVLEYAVPSDPRAQPKTVNSTLSTQPKLKTNGPKKPTARLFTVTLTLNHSMHIWAYPMKEMSCFSSGSTRVIPRASRPARPSILSFHLFSLPLRTTGVDDISGAPSEVFSSELLPLNEETWMSASLSLNPPRFSTSSSGI